MKKLYQASLYNWKTGSLENNPAKLNEVEMLYRESIRMSPKNTDYKHNLANFLIESKDPAKLNEAEILYKEVIRLDPDDPWFTTSLASFYHHSKSDKENALKYYQQALELMRQNP